VDEQALWAEPITFESPENPTQAEAMLAKDIVQLDHSSLWTFEASRERGEVYRLLGNVIVFLNSRQPDAARRLLDHAEAVFLQHIQAKNRLRYLAGMLAGIAVIVLFGWALIKFLPPAATSNSAALEFPPPLLPMILLFAGMGTITSVLTRLSSIDLRDQTSMKMLLVSGMARPVTGLFFALAIYLMISLRIVDFHLGAGADPTPPALFLFAAFLSGFSERFAQDILTKVGGVVSASEPRKPAATRKHAPPTNHKETTSE
jgi:hypothetical protein